MTGLEDFEVAGVEWRVEGNVETAFDLQRFGAALAGGGAPVAAVFGDGDGVAAGEVVAGAGDVEEQAGDVRRACLLYTSDAADE